MRRWPIALSAALLCSCASAPQTHFYRLTPARVVAGQRVVAGVLAIQTFDSDSVYSSDQIVYRGSPTRVDYYNYHRWISPPAIQLTDYFADALARSGLFRYVQADLTGAADAVLSGRVLAFDELDVSASRWEARAEIELNLEDPARGPPYWSKRYRATEPIGVRTPEGVAVALSAAMQRIVLTSAAELAAAMRTRAPASYGMRWHMQNSSIGAQPRWRMDPDHGLCGRHPQSGATERHSRRSVER